MRSPRASILTVALTLLLGAGGAHAVDGVTEINDASIAAAGGYPFVLPAAGSYVLTGNLMPPLGTTALVAGADDIEIDLNGFEILSPGGGAPSGIDSAGFTGMSVRNGSIRGFDGGPAIVLGPDGRVTETKLRFNGAGIDGASTCLIVMNVIAGNVGVGLSGVVAEQCKIENNIIAANETGITGFGNVIVNNEIIGNVAFGGILDAGGSTIQNNIIIANAGAGITDGDPCAGAPPAPPPIGTPRSDIMGNVIDNNFLGDGISYCAPVLVTDNTVTNNFGWGIDTGEASTVRGNVVDTNNLGCGPPCGGVRVAGGSNVHANSISWTSGPTVGLMIPCTSGYQNNTISFNGPDVVLVGCPGSVTGGAGNNCTGLACP